MPTNSQSDYFHRQGEATPTPLEGAPYACYIPLMEKKGKVFVGMSGGVDSSVSALLLKEAGYDVIGVFIKVWQADFLPCSWRDERRDAMRAAAHLQIPFLTLDLEKEYKKEVVDYMIREYREGRIPNPDVMCNKHVKFGAFLTFAEEHGADFIATGHYARIEKSDEAYRLLAGVDKEKDQSYFLWTLEQNALPRILFPVGGMEKSEVRSIAEKNELPNAGKKDSQGLCFMGQVDMEDFLKHYIKTKKGDVLDKEGKVIGEHEGSELYTIGQRHGFTATNKGSSDEPYFVVSKNIETNTITVAHRSEQDGNIQTLTFRVENLLLRNYDKSEEGLMVRIRYRGALVAAQLRETAGVTTVVPSSPFTDLASGQSAVFYRKEECLGGGIIML